MRRLAAITATAFLSTAAIGINMPCAGAATTHTSTIRILGALHLRRVDTTTGQNQVTLLLCTATTTDDNPPVIHGLGALKNPSAACAELEAVQGDFDKLAVHPAWMAPALEAPVQVRACGVWEGAKVDWSHRYSNSGWLTKTTGEVFVF